MQAAQFEIRWKNLKEQTSEAEGTVVNLRAENQELKAKLAAQAALLARSPREIAELPTQSPSEMPLEPLQDEDVNMQVDHVTGSKPVAAAAAAKAEVTPMGDFGLAAATRAINLNETAMHSGSTGPPSDLNAKSPAHGMSFFQ